jgi:hypothetical protein
MAIFSKSRLLPQPANALRTIMARRSDLPQPQPGNLTVQQMRQGIDRLQKRLDEVRKFEPTSVTEQYNIPHVDALAASVGEALDRTFGANTPDYNWYSDAAIFDNGSHNYAFHGPHRAGARYAWPLQGPLYRVA